MGLSCLTAVGNCETNTLLPGSEAQSIIFILGIPLSQKPLTPFMVPMPLCAWLQGEAYCLIVKSVWFKNKFEFVLDKGRARVSAHASVLTHEVVEKLGCVHLYSVHREMLRRVCTAHLGQQVRNDSRGMRLLTTVCSRPLPYPER